MSLVNWGCFIQAKDTDLFFTQICCDIQMLQCFYSGTTGMILYDSKFKTILSILFHLAQFILSGSLLKPPLSPAFPLNLLMETPSPPPAAVEVQRNKSNLEVYLYIYKRKKEKWIKQIFSFVIGNIGNNIRVYKRTKIPAGCLCLGNTPVIPLNLVSDLNQCFFHESYRCYHENMFSLCLKMTHMLTLDTEELRT